MEDLIARITDSELEILKVLWQAQTPMSITQIKKAVAETMPWEDSTIKTLVGRLCKKEVVQGEKRGIYTYTPRITQEQYNEYKTQQVIDHLYKGSAKNLVAALVEKNKLSEEDRMELQNLFRMY